MNITPFLAGVFDRVSCPSTTSSLYLHSWCRESACKFSAVSVCDEEIHCLRPCSMAKRLFSTALHHDTVQQVFEKLGSKMDFTAGVSVAALTFVREREITMLSPANTALAQQLLSSTKAAT